jgi:hypothetical protein
MLTKPKPSPFIPVPRPLPKPKRACVSRIPSSAGIAAFAREPRRIEPYRFSSHYFSESNMHRFFHHS